MWASGGAFRLAKKKGDGMSILIDKEFESLIPPLTAEEFQQLEENCVKEGIRDALITWDGILIDGHNRFKIAAKHGLQWTEKKMEFADRDEAKLWIIRNQKGRRNLDKLTKIDLRLKEEKLVAKQVKARRGGDRKSEEYKKSIPLNKGNDKHQTSTNARMAKEINMSEDTYRKGKAILESGNQQVIEDVKQGRESINSGYQRIHPKKTPAQSNKEFIEKAEQEHEDFQNSKTVSMHDIQMDKANRQILASNTYSRLLNMGVRINDVAIDMEQGKINLREMCKEIDAARIKSLKTTIRMVYEQLMKIDKELTIG